ncbi:MAG: riboflavin synthase [Candidatus Omnitrophota bacterium]|nr:riboflavin synthase [Candidatus Omnitrophota bacterium]
MFSGIIEERARVGKILKEKRNCRLIIKCAIVSNDTKAGDSISVNGVCLTVTGIEGKSLSFDIMEETLRATSFSGTSTGDVVNLERALKAGARISGHFVTGHVDCVAKVISITAMPNDYTMEIEVPEDGSAYIAKKGSIAVDGVSLTIAEAENNSLKVCLIPFTLKETSLGLKKAGDEVNIEFDILSKYSVRDSAPAKSKIDTGFLKEHGFL